MGSYIPPESAKAEKQGFSAPDASWFKGESIEFVRKTLLKNDALIYKYLDPSAIKNLLQQHMSGENNRRLLIWSLINVETWLEVNKIS
jgi:asparagine synthase (glutamine-hydrolysing)